MGNDASSSAIPLIQILQLIAFNSRSKTMSAACTRLDVRASGSSIDLDRAETAAFEACCNRAIDWKTIKKVSRFRAESAWNRGF